MDVERKQILPLVDLWARGDTGEEGAVPSA